MLRRKYYINGRHAGFIMYMTDTAQNQEDVNNIRQAMKSAKASATCLRTRPTAKRTAFRSSLYQRWLQRMSF